MLTKLWRRREAPETPAPFDGASLISALSERVSSLEAHARDLEARYQKLAQDEALRAAEHATMVDQLTRLYKRVAARIARESDQDPTNGDESVAALKRRLGRGL